ncbi:hypothetical protein B0A48_11275 [Cryoendolithus antarcticus]|uniref:JmjC domain-containing protein n=1 Tax=Cryoendolithus antarcticus TaxID=1507870 RepID=A0A1V8SVC7_9PEZI|nr:hypothetical protein B0A48_11275 [Cryoendolithus antarcticus]
MPAQRPRASFDPIPPDFDLKALVESTPNFSYVDRIGCDMIDEQGIAAFEKLVLLHVINGGKPLVIDGFDDRLDPWTFQPKWLRDNCGDKVEQARDLRSKEYIPLSMKHYLKNMSVLTNQFFEQKGAYKDKKKQRVYLKDIDCPPVWWDKVREQIPESLAYLNDNTGEAGGPGSVPDGQVRASKGIARAGDLMSSLPPEMRAENLMCYIGHEGTYTPAHREMCASLGQNIMVEASANVDDEGKITKPGSSIWFMTESNDRHTVAEYWLDTLGHDIEVENHFAQVVAWKKAPFNVYVVEQRPGDLILIPPLAPHQVWNRGTRTMKVAWNRTTVETLEMALNEALPRSRIVCRDEQYKNKAIIYFTLQKYSGLLSLAQQQAGRMTADNAHHFLHSTKIRQLIKDFKKLFMLYRQVLLSEMFNPDDCDTPKNIEYLPFDSNVTCAYCRGNIFNRFLSCGSCKDMLGHDDAGQDEGDPYDVCMDCYAMGRSCYCISNLKCVEQFRWKELASKYETWRKMIVALDGGSITDRTPLTLNDERRRYGKKTLAEICKDQLKRRPWKDVHKSVEELKSDAEEDDEEIIVGDDGMVKKVAKKKSKTWLKNNTSCHVCQKRHPNWKMAFCTTCDRAWCYGSLFRGWDKMPVDIMEDQAWSCPHCLGICFAGACVKEGKSDPYQPKGTLLGHDTKKVADARSVEALVDFSVSNLNWLKDDDAVNRTESSRIKRAKAAAQKAKEDEAEFDDDHEHDIEPSRVEFEYSPPADGAAIDPALTGDTPSQLDEDAVLARRLRQANDALPSPAAMVAGAPSHGAFDGYAPVRTAGYVPPAAQMHVDDQDDDDTYNYPDPMDVTNGTNGDSMTISGSKRKHAGDDDDGGDYEDISMTKGKKAKRPRLAAAGFRSLDLAETENAPTTSKSEVQRQFEKERERNALERAKSEGRFIMMQARLKGKKRVVILSIPSHRLAEIQAKETARAALAAANGEDMDAEHEVDDSAEAQLRRETLDEAGPEDLLKSDLAPRKLIDPKTLSRERYKRREREGHIITSNTKKALIPVEKDENYTAYRPERVNPGVKSAASTKGNRGRKSAVQYEEVDIASDDEQELLPSGNTDKDANRHRTLPTYLSTRAAEDSEVYPDALPNEPRPPRERGPQHRKPGARSRAVSDTTTTAAPATNGTPTDSTISRGRPPAGKKPSMRPASSFTPVNGTVPDAASSSDDDEEATPPAAVPRTTSSATLAPSPKLIAQTQPVAKTRGRPSLLSTALNNTTPTLTPKPSTPVSKPSPKAALIQNDNVRAKLQALEAIGGDASPGASASTGKRVRFSTGVVKGGMMIGSSEEESSDDEVESVPARRVAGKV